MIDLPKLPYKFSDLEPDISAKTMEVHYNKHHRGYVQKTNELIRNTPLDQKTLSEIVLTSAADTIYTTLFHNSAQAYNHDFFWNSISPKGTVSSALLPLIEKNFQSLSLFQAHFLEHGLSHFASGWLWLVTTADQQLKILTTANANTPLTDGNLIPLLCLDLWEHSYYLDYQNRRADYLKGLINNHLNWKFAEENFLKQRSRRS